MNKTKETQLIHTPHPMNLEGQRNITAQLLPGERLSDFLDRHITDFREGRWAVAIGGRIVPQDAWAYVFPKDGQVIEVRTAFGKQALYIVALAALTYFTFGLGAGVGGAWGAAGGLAGAVGGGIGGALLATAVYMGGPSLGKKVLA